MKLNEEGSILVLVLLIMSVITMVGIVSIKSTTVDHMVSRNNRQFSRDFYNAEAALNRAIQNIQTLPSAPANAYPLTTDVNNVFNPDVPDSQAWYRWWSPLMHPDRKTPLALIEVRRISATDKPTDSITDGGKERQLTANANRFPAGTYRDRQSREYNIVKMVVTATAVDPVTKELTGSSVQGGTAVYVMPSDQL